MFCQIGRAAENNLGLGMWTARKCQSRRLPFDRGAFIERAFQTGQSGLLSRPDNAAYIPYSTSFARFGKMQIRQTSGTSEATIVGTAMSLLRRPAIG